MVRNSKTSSAADNISQTMAVSGRNINTAVCEGCTYAAFKASENDRKMALRVSA